MTKLLSQRRTSRAGAKRRALVISLIVGGALLAAASSFGAPEPSAVRMGEGAVGACDANGVETSFSSAWDRADGRYEVTAVSITDVSKQCANQLAKVVVTDSNGAELGKGSAAIRPNSHGSVDVSLVLAPSAETAAGIHVVIGSSA